MTQLHTKDEKMNTEIFSKWMRVSFPDLWSLSSRISRKSCNTKFPLKSDEDIKQPQIQKKEPQLYFLVRTLLAYS